MPAAAGPGSPAFLRRAPTPPADVGRSAAAGTAGAAARHQEGAGESAEVQPRAEASPRVSPFSQPHLHRFERDGDCGVTSGLMLFLGFHFGSSSSDFCRNPFWSLSTTQKEEGCPAPALIFFTGRKVSPANQTHSGTIRRGRQRHPSTPEHRFILQQG